MMRRLCVIPAAIVLLLCTSIPAQAEEHEWLVKHPTIQKLLQLHNAERQRNGLPALTLDPRMCLDAQRHALWMANTGNYQHSNLPYGEIIHHGPLSVEKAVHDWIYSPPHHRIMLTGTQAGFGYTVINGRTYWVGVFK